MTIMNFGKSIIKLIIKLIRERTAIVVLVLYCLTSSWFYGKTFLKQLILDRSQSGWEVIGEIRASEWGIEKIIGKLDQGINPFSRISEIVYPYGIDIVASDVGLAFLVAPWRGFLSIHQALMLVVVGGMIMGGWGMYLLLREMGIGKMNAFLMGLAFENNTFLLPRMGHVGYLATFWVFPWFFWLWQKFLRCQKPMVKVTIVIAGALLYLLSLWLNFYYFIILSLGIGMLIGFQLVSAPKKIFSYLIKQSGYAMLFIASFFAASWGWVETLIKTLKFSEAPRPMGWGGAIEFSADLFNVVVPSPYNYYYGWLIPKIAARIGFIQGIFEDYNYPGIIILASMGVIGYLVIRKLNKQWVRTVFPYFVATLFFLILTWGPFLQIGGRMFVELEEGIRVVLPLPYVLLHYLPYLIHLRVPGRLEMGMVFFGTIVAGLVIDKIARRLSHRQKIGLSLLLFVTIVIDQRPVEMQLEPVRESYPQKIYQRVANDKETESVILIPFTIRDGLTWFGDYNSVYVDYAQMYLNKPIIGGYTGRIPDYIKEYYRSNPLVGKLGREIDKNLITNPFMLNIPERDPWRENIELARATAQLLGIKYVIVKGPDPVEKYLKQVGYNAVMSEREYLLYEIKINNNDYLDIDLGSEGDHLQLGMGWWGREPGYRWTRKKSSIIVKNVEAGEYGLSITGESYHLPQDLEVYLDEELVGKTLMEVETTTKEIGTVYLAKGIHKIHLLWRDEYKPFEVSPGNLDARELAGRFRQIKLERVR